MDRREIGRILAKAREDGATTLDLTGKGLGTLPPEIGNLTNLRLLALSFNDLTVLPAEIGNLTNLVNLYLNHNQLWVLPPQIGKLSSLQYLNLRDNRLMGLPREIGNLTLLTNLDLRSNQLTELSPQLGTLIERGVVNVSGNPLAELLNKPTQEIQAQGQNPPSEQEANLLQTPIYTANSHQFLNGWGNEGDADGEFHGPYGIAVDGEGYVYVADGGNHRIQVFDPSIKKKLAPEDFHITDYSIWDGFDIEGWPTTTILRGKVVVENGQFSGSTSDGKFQTRKIDPEFTNRPAC